MTPNSTLVGYGRVSTDKQTTQLQRDALNDAGCTRVYEETVSGTKRHNERPQLAAALDWMRPGDTLVVWRLDRLGRSTRDVLTIAEDLHERGIGLQVLAGTIAGTYSPTGEGKFLFTMLAALAELERDILVERTKAGLKTARANGHQIGRPRSLTGEQITAAKSMLDNGQSVASVARTLNVSRATLYRQVPDLTAAT